MAVPAILKDNLSIPVIGSPLFIISNPDLVIAQCKAGVIGSFPALNARPEPVLEEWLDRITSELKDHDKNNPDKKVSALRGEPNCARLQCAAEARHGYV
jgi:nitronate monooxygenase